MSDMSVKEAYRVLQAACEIEGGDTVRIVRGYMESEADKIGFYSIGLCKEFNQMIGKTKRVVAVCRNYIELPFREAGNTIFAPFYCLELVEKAEPGLPPIEIGGHKVAFLDDRIRVCDISVSHKTLREILKRVEEQN